MSRRTLALGILITATAGPLIAFWQYSFAQSDDAQVVLSEGIVASSTIETIEASTTVSDVVEGNVEEESIDEPVEAVSDFDKSLTSDEIDKIIQTIADSQASYFEKNGKYLQILPNQKLPEYESGTVEEKLGAVPNSITVNVYEGPKGKGFQVIYRDKGTVKAVGYGPEAEELSYTTEIEVVDMSVATTTASSTVDVVDATTAEETATSTDSTTDTDQSDDAGTTTPAIDKKTEDSISAPADDGSDDATDPGAPETPTTTVSTE